MIEVGTLVALGLAWAAILFGVALYGDRHPGLFDRWGALVQGLSLAVYCTSWTFYGMVTQAASHGWLVPPTFLGTMALLVFGFPFLLRLCRYAREQNATSIADLVGARFDQDLRLAALVTGVALLGLVPYIALQLRAVAEAYERLVAPVGAQPDPAAWQDVAFWVAAMMAGFAMLFGTRRAAATEYNRGLTLAMAFESLFKLAVILGLGLYALWRTQPHWDATGAQWAFLTQPSHGNYLALFTLGALAMFTLPHQVQIGVIGPDPARHFRAARWLFCAYLGLMSLAILALGWAGYAEGRGTDDFYAIALPLRQGHVGVALVGFLGGISAATGMVIMAAITLSIMISNHWVLPLLFRRAVRNPAHDMRGALLRVRRMVIAAVLLLAWWYSRKLGSMGFLADIGSLSVSALVQLAPGVVIAVYGLRVRSRAIIHGLLAGVAFWSYLLVVPMLARAGVIDAASLQALGAFGPEQFLGLDSWDLLTRALFISLAANTLAIVLSSTRDGVRVAAKGAPITVQNLRTLASHFLTPAQIEKALYEDPAHKPDPAAQIAAIERELTSILGGASARLLLDTAERGHQREAMVNFVGEASAAVHFSQALLEVALENMSQGISVVDRDLRLLAWNQRYAKLFQYPPELLRVGTPVELLVRHNAERGLLGAGPVEELIARRVAHLRAGTPYVAERLLPDGTVIEIRGNPMPGGGFVATFTDVSASRRTESELKRLNETLEQRVIERTAESERARIEAERANQGKSRFLAAIGHDLLQPINAAHLFTHALAQQLRETTYRDAVAQIDGALTSTESLVSALLDISRLDAGGFVPRPTRFAVDEMLKSLGSEFQVLASEKGLRFKRVRTKAWVESDPQLLRRVVQNFLANAIRYTEKGRILLGVRRRATFLAIEVWDTGSGIAESDQAVIFEEFRRLNRPGGSEGLGLGLAIADRIAKLMKHRIFLRSRPGRGTVFGIEVPRIAATPIVGIPKPLQALAPPRSRILLVENDVAVGQAMCSLLRTWHCDVFLAKDFAEAQAHLAGPPPDLLLLDYHLDGNRTGLDVRAQLGDAVKCIPTVVITADRSDGVRDAVAEAGCFLLHKPLRPLALKSLMSRILAR